MSGQAPERLSSRGPLWAALWLVLCLMLGQTSAWAQSSTSGFDHAATGYPLVGMHEEVRCETCHQRGIFKGTPRDCATCHAQNNSRGALAMPSKHVQISTNQGCDSCHTVNSFAGAIFTHFGVSPGGCASCHNGNRAPGKPLGHPSTAASCDQCHGTTKFLPAAAKSANHIPTAVGSTCSDCHRSPNFAVMPPLAAIHAFAPSTSSGCATCHGDAAASFAVPATGFAIQGKPANHLPTSAACELCHTGAGTPLTSLPVGNGAKFSGAVMSHAGIAGGCANCHLPNGAKAAFAGISSIVGMPATAPVGTSAHIPTSAACENCHLASMPATPLPANAARQPPGSGFATPAPSGAQIHAGITSGCAACHETNAVWMGMGAYPAVQGGGVFSGFQTRPQAVAGPNNVADPAHPSSGDCSQCHASTSGFSAVDKPANHIPFAATAQCNSCHISSNFAVMPSLSAIHANAPSTTSNCAQCHGAAAASFAIPAANFAIVGLPGNHIPTSASCEVCHVGPGSSMAATPVTDSARFAGALMNHAGIGSNCVACHQPAGSATSFVGINRIVGMPPTSPVGVGSHIPSGTNCEACHLATVPAGLVPASGTTTAPGTGFASPAPSSAQIHNGVSSGCAACHEANAVWMGMGAYPIAPTTLVNGASYTGFQTRPRTAAGTFNVADAAHPSGGDCAQCHSSTNAFSGVDKPANHIPYAVTAQCSSCHTGTDYGVLPTLAAIHANAPSTSSNCAQCHGAAAASFAIPAANFAIVGLPTNHIPTTASCELCHVGAGSSITSLPVGNGARFAGSLMSHSGISSNCVACHVPAGTNSSFAGISRIVGMPATSPAGSTSHIPSGTACEACHLASLPSGLIAASATTTAPGTAFASPAPSGAQIHNGITAGCSSCHETGQTWLGMGAYPASPTTLVAGAAYKGFQTRPKAAATATSPADAAHPGAGDCSQCHGNTTAFTGVDKPANHIPFAATAQCSACHTSADYAVLPTITAIHANAPSTSNNCAQCHGPAAGSFAIPAVGFAIVGQPADHIPTSAACEACHVAPGSSITSLPVINGSKFSGSLMNHAGISSNCVACHQPAGSSQAFAGIGRVVGMPPTSPAGAGSHIPSGTACETCHLATVPVGLVPATATKTAPGTGFGSPAPSGAQIHSGVTSGCSSCHEASMVWMGVSAYPITPSTLVNGASYNGFQTRPRAVAGAFNVADPAHPSAGDCSACHGSTTVFTGIDRPANHIPFAPTAQCSSCHTGSDYAVMPSLANIHANAPSTTANCAQCHGAAAASFAIPAANFAIVGLPGNHIPTSASCEVCHVGAGSSVAALPVGNGAKFSGSLMNHSGISGNCVACHATAGAATSFVGINRIVGMPPTSPAGAGSHIPSGTACESCHLAAMPSGPIAATATRSAPGTAFATPAPSGAQVHNGVTGGCASCHEAGMVWMGISAYPIAPNTLVNGALYKGFQTRPGVVASATSVADAAHPVGGDCGACHGNTTAFSGVDKPANHIPYAATARCDACHTSTDFAALPTVTNIHANAPSTSTNCAQCHGAAAASFAIPSAGFSIVGLPGNHIPTSASCEVCHVGAGSSIATTPVVNGARFSGSLMNHAGISSNCAACHTPASVSASFVGISRIVGMPPTSPAGAGAHIPSASTCETCHLASMPAGLVSASATKTAPGTGFASPAPSGAQIHNGVTSGCASCHEASMVWMGVSAYPISPSTLIAGASYTGFQTRPRSVASATNVADPAHPVGGDCSACHGSTTAFTGVDKPANHIPYAASAQCNSCHTSTDYAVMPSLANIHAYAPSTSGNCAQCHGAAAASFAIPSANFSIVGLPSNHIPTTASCEVCHVGAGSSITALPVANGAKFSSSLMNHAGISSNCVACHQPSGSSTTFAGITRLVGMPPTSPAGAGSHIPSGTACETCHLATLPAGLIAANASKTAPGTAFATPAPSGAQIHAGVTSGCVACHDTGMVWMGVSAYPITPSTLVNGASYNGFQTRPRAAAGTFNVADAAHPTAGDCAACHGSTTAFTGIDKPANHIPFAASAQCNSCHTSTDYAVMPTLANIHANAPSATNNCAQCHGAAAASFAIPTANFSIVGLPGNHIPTSASCEVCHVGAGSSVAALPVSNGAKFSGSLMNHSGIGSNCVACHQSAGSTTNFAGIARIVGMPPTSPAGSGAHIPSGTTCESCHLATLPNGLIPASATATAPGTAFATPAPSGAQIHSGVTSGCSNCHEAGMVWLGVSAYPISPSTLIPGASYNGFQTRPRAAAGTYNVADAAHPVGGDCAGCHGSTTAFTGIDKPANHIPYAASARCDSCHTGSDYSVLPTLANIHANAPSTSANCAQCHGAAAATFAIPSANFSIVGLATNHIPTTASCEVCHVGAGSSIAATPVGNGAKFSGSLMNHAGISGNCVACHQASGSSTNFTGIGRIVGMPPTSPAGAGSHIPSGTSCETCHLATMPAGLIPASATRTAPGTAFASPAPTGAMIHSGVTAGCASCHEASMVWMGVSAYPITPSTLIPGASYNGFQTRPRAAAGTYNVADAAHPVGGDCVACHGSTTAFTGIDKPANHIPYAASARCDACHTGSDFGVMPTLANIHANAPSTSSNCAQCHGDAAASFAIPAANFSIVGLPSNHIPTTASCEVCHVGTGSSIAATPVGNGAKFSGSLMSHAGISSNCVACHQPSGSSTTFAGITRLVGMPPTSPAGASSHIPSGTPCESCHLATVPSGLIPANASKAAPGSGFATPAPSGAMIHSGVTSGCSSCHEAGMVWMGMGAYPISPGTLINGASYNGFQTRPRAAAGTYNVADAAHPAAGDCVACHGSTTAFTGIDKPANHIPYAATARCDSCHTGSDFGVMPTLANIHANAPSTTTNCAQCHGAAAASFAIPSANFSIVGLPGNHIPTTASCEVCHVGAGSSIAATPVSNGAKFSGSLMNHSGIGSNCVACHQPASSTTNFAGIARIVGMPPTSPAGSSAHIPSGTTCESCHLATLPSGPIPASATATAPGTGFATPAPSGVQIHSGITGGCASCHEANMVWMGVSAYPISPTTLIDGASYKGFQTRPRATASATSVADAAHPSSGECAQCHVSTTAFTGVEKPANHIPYATGATCSSCHTSNDYAVMPTLTSIHANAPSTSANCAQCHGAAAASFAIPAANFSILGLPGTHIPTTASCEVCHVGAGSSIAATPVVDGAKFSSSLMNHAGISANCVACHTTAGSGTSFTGISRIVGMPATTPAGANAHIPSGTTCETCHLGSMPSGLIPANATKTAPGTAFATPAPTGVMIHSGVTSGCSNCHEAGLVWMGVSAYPITPNTLVNGASYTGFQTRPRAAAGTFNVADAAHPTSGDCGACHGNTTAFTGVDKPANHIPYAASAQCNSCHTSTDYAVMPSLANIHAYAPSTTTNCAQCHGAAAASFAIPSANFSIVGLPGNHIPTTASCEVCHVGAGSSIAALPVANGARFSGSLMSHTGISSNCVACHQPSGSSTAFAGVTRIVGMPPTSPAGASSHIPSSTTCETCHLASMPAGLIPASATKTAPGTAFATPAPTGAQIHSGVTSGCDSCHEANMVWMGVSAYPISPSTLVPGASYNGFQTRPRAAAGTYNVADAAHPVGGDCAGCHGSTTAFTGIDKPANHIPYAASARCDSCHTGSDYSVLPTLANIHANAPSTSANCAQCHGAAAATFAIPSANFSIVGLATNHIPTTASCEVCHVGAGSSIAATPVGNGAKFSGSLMNHAGISGNCVACHVAPGTSVNFTGITRLIGMPPTSPPGAGSHIPSGTTCETCHLSTVPAGLIPASATRTAPGSLFASPAPSGVQIHTGVTSGCANCHEAGMVWMGMGAYPISPTTLSANAKYNGFQTRPVASAGLYNVADATHPGAGDCGQCHTNTVAFTGVEKPANHIPTSATAQCSSCHIGTDYSVLPTLAAIHANAPSTTNNCAQCHGAAAATFAIPSANFSIVGLPSGHIPTTASCEVCHVGAGSSIAALPVSNGAKFSGSLMNHAGINNNCVACHQPSGSSTSFAGITRIVGMPPTSPAGAGSHIPSGTACETCHLATLPAGLMPASATKTAPGTAFATPAPSGAQIHNGVTSGCSNCHDAGMVWMGVSAYPITPSTLVNGASYNGFQTRPRAAAGPFNVADAAHPTSGDCGQCHASTTAFTGIDKPTNHIPYAATAQCNSCHTSSDFAALPALANIHANAPSTTTNCAQCHGAAAASFAIPANGFAVVGLPGNHIPTSASCEVCHVGAGSSVAALPVGNGAKFSSSLMSHSGITSNCVACHQASGSSTTFAGIARLVGMPPTSPAGATSHIPSGTTCESCHLATVPSGLIAATATATAPGTGFATPAPSGAQIHAGVTSGCSTCHEAGMVWMGMGAYPISPSTLVAGGLYKGFQTRPRSAAGPTNVADAAHPLAGDCAQCHSGTTAFTGVDKPANHIPYSASAQCNSCHTSTDYGVMPSITAIHAYAPSLTSNCAQCHGAAAASFAIPAANFSIVGLPGNHIPTSASCEVCHVGLGSSIAAAPVVDGAKFSNALMNHSGISNNCVACHQVAGSSTSFTGIARIVGMPPTSPAGSGSHIPSATTCETCHLATMPAGLIAPTATATAPGTAFATPAPSGAQIHNGVTSGCVACHEAGMVWMGMGAYPAMPATLTTGAQYKGFQTRPQAAGGGASVTDPAHPTTGDCMQCHSGTSAFSGIDKPANHIPYATNAACNSCHTSTDYSAAPQLTNIHANAPSTTTNCAQCHGPAAASFAIPAAGFAIVGQPSNHIPTTAACELCHVGAGSSIAATPVVNGAKFSGSLMNHSGISSNCASCHQPASNSTAFAGIARLIGMPPTSPAGATSHIPSGTTCETCHVATMPVGMIPASATKTAPGTGFATPAPTGAQIHSGVTSGCDSCHEANMVWMGVSAYPISPSTLVPGASYNGFQTRPRAAAGTYNVADAAHPVGGDCAGCHGSTTAFTGIDKPANHIPYAASARCDSCHTGSDYSVLPTLANIHANAPSTSANCAQCHGAAAATFAIPSANFSIVGLATNHIPTTASCEVCHVGAGSSIAATPVGNGAKFSGSLMNHGGITSNCVACHVAPGTSVNFTGITRLIGMPPTSPPGAGSHIPSGTTCETCHLSTVPAGLIPASATRTAPGSLFASPAPSGVQIHTGVISGCANCHEAGMVWMGMGAYPISPTTLVNGASYTGFQTRPSSAAGTYNVADAAHPTSGDCAQCHASTTAFTGVDKPANHIPFANTAQCNSCHTSTDYAVMPTVTAIHAFAPSVTGNCAQCHGAAAASFAIPANNFAIVGLPANHIPTTASCEACHVGAGSSIAATPVVDGARFAGSMFAHVGTPSTCVTCHAPKGTLTDFAGMASSDIVHMPATSPMGPNAHIPSSTACETCHTASLPSGQIAARAVRAAPGTGFATPAPTGTMIHNGVTSGCAACHEANAQWMGMGAYPISPSTLTTGAQYKGFQTRPTAVGTTNSVADVAHPASGDCAQCHASTTAFTGVTLPGNHIPYASGAQCNACHTNVDYAVSPSLANIHANAPSTTANCAQCHGAAAASFAIPAANFSIVGLPNNHIPTTASCEVCHVGPGSSIAALPVGDGAKFSGSLMNHASISSNCVSCHLPSSSSTTFAGIARTVGMPPTSPPGIGSHIPSSTTCESCHLASMPSGLIPASATLTAPGTAFATPAPTGAQIHSGITSGCASCHEASMVWMGVSAYPIAPTTLINGANYTGFQTRPRSAAGTYNVADPAHPGAGDCAQCHAGTTAFTGIDKPGNHIPYSQAAQCSSCHTSSDYAVLPTLANIHAFAPSTSSNCAQCHGAAAPSFAIPSANFSIVGLPGNHIPTTASCEVCHVGAGSSIAALPVANGARFSGSLMSHTGISSNCVACHQPSGSSTAFAGVTRIVGMPPTSPAGASSHIPSSTTCETCHLASMPAGLVPASATTTAPGTAFATPAPSGAQIHSGVTAGCASCHEASLVWMGVSAYPISPSTLIAGASYTGFQTRPRSAPGTNNVADPAHPTSGDCALCHASTTAFTGIDKPANHIPYAVTAQCNSCHTSSDYAVMPSLANIHAYAPSQISNCAQCHGAAAASFAIPSANFSIVGLPAGHIPTTASCEVCHVAAGSSITALPVGNGARFSGSVMNHAGISSNCVACHQPSGSSTTFTGITRIVGMPPTSPAVATSHIPSSTTCETCHLANLPAGLLPASATATAPGTAFASPAPTGAQIHAGVTGGCTSCHEAGMVWMGMGAYPASPNTLIPGTQYHGFQTRPRAAGGTYNVADAAHPDTRDCVECHSGTSYFAAQDKPANHIPYAGAATCDDCHNSTDYKIQPTLTAIHANAPSTTVNCVQCHGAAAASFAIPAAGFSIVGLPSNHLPTTASCEVCHVGAGSSITTLPVTTGAKFSGSLMNHAGISTNCVSCHVTSGTSSAFAGITRVVSMPPTSPAGAGSHIPSSTACEACHLPSLPTGLIAATATKTAPGTAFATPAPTGAMIHAGVTSGCAGCHDSSLVWMGVGAYPISPSTVTTGAQYKGFQTRPRTTAGTYNVADPAHPTTGDCSQCHGNTTAFTGVDVPANHIPFANTAQCNSCHTSSDYAVMPSITAIHAFAPSTTGNCAQCHGSTAASFAIPAAGFSIVGLPTNHIPTSESCEVCHVGTGSSIATTPVVNGARFSGSLMNHLRITSNCVACHQTSGNVTNFAGITSIVGLPPTSPMGAGSHIPSSTTCETCHLGSTPSGLIPASATKKAPGTAFATPVPTGVMIHNGITSGCSSCHDTNAVWMGMANYPITPSTLTAGALYKGFQTRPVAGASTYRVADAGHPTTGECSLCHTSTTAFGGVNTPSNHIPYNGSAACIACHTDVNYAVMPTLANIHANAQSTTINCAQCHSAAAVAQFAIPSAGFSIVGLPTNGTHIPTTASCEVCHVGTGSSIATTPVGNGAKFSGSRMSHSGISTNCVACHTPSGTVAAPYTGITRIVGMPPTSPVGTASHIPSNTVCENCHSASSVSGLIPASATKTAPGTLFNTPTPTGTQIHTGITSGCSSCHDTNYVWMGMSASLYQITPSVVTSGAQYKGFQTRPQTAGGTFWVADAGHPTTGDCGTCHVGTTYFDGAAKPTGHIPTTATCTTCHKVSGNFTISGLGTNAQIHTGITSGCRSCHAGGPYAGSGSTSSTLCATASLPYVPVPMPLSACGASPTTSSATTHIPVGSQACELCHGSTNFASFKMSSTKDMRPGTTTGPVPGTTMHTVGVPSASFTCMSCHETPYKWMGVSIKVRDDANHHAGQDCDGSGCHKNTSSSFAMLIRPVPVRRAAVNGALPRQLPQGLVGTGANTGNTRFNHQGVIAGQCQTCHNGQLAKARPAKHYGNRLSCDACHRTTAWSPAQFSHQASMAGQCATCHNGVDAVARPGTHFVTVRACDACHRSTAWLPVKYQHLSPAYQFSPDKPTCLSCHITNGEVIPRQMHGNPRTRPIPAGS